MLKNLERGKRRISFDGIVNYDVIYNEGVFDTIVEHLNKRHDETIDLTTFEKLRLIKKEREDYCLTNLWILFSKIVAKG
jgi:hypothetical protein